jgi:cytoskeletal protein CcmA (bactofilin family)
MPKIDTVIGRSAHLKGGLEFAGALHVEGRICGDVRARDGAESTLSVGEHGCVEGAVEVGNLILDGSVTGPVHAPGSVVLGARARLHGDVYYGDIEMTLGAKIIGRLVRLTGQAEAASQSSEALLTPGP